MEGTGVKEYLQDIGRDVASSLGEELKGVAKDKATSFVKEQFGLGFQDELKSAGREILSSVGDELKGAAKDKAVSLIKEQFGLGIQDDVKAAGREILSSVGDELKGAAKEKAMLLIREQLGLGMDGGAIARPCSIRVADLRKAITAARRANHIVGRATKEQLMEIGEGHADMSGKYARAVGKYLQGNMTVPRLREMRGLIKGAFHRPVSTMTMDEAVEYIFWTAKELGWTWSQLDGIAPKQRQARGCRISKHPGSARDPPARKQRAPSAYNLFVQKHMKDPANKVDEDGDALSTKERFSNAVAAWKAGGTRRAAGKKAAQTRRNKKEDAARRAQVRKEIFEERKEAANKQTVAERKKSIEKFGDDFVRKRIPRKAKSNAPKQYGKGAAYDSGSDDE